VNRRLSAIAETAAALCELAHTTVLFRVRGSRAVSAAARRAMQRSSELEVGVESRWDVWRSVRALRRAEVLWPLPVLCLQRSLTLQAMLDRHEVPSRLHIGSRLEGGTLEAHAWVECGPYVFDAGSGGFLPFPPPRVEDAAPPPVARDDGSSGPAGSP
jgi:hypothetical protein